MSFEEEKREGEERSDTCGRLGSLGPRNGDTNKCTGETSTDMMRVREGGEGCIALSM